MSKYGQYCPVARAADILGDRWTLLIVRDLLTGVCHFNDLERGLPGIPKALLAERLRRLRRDGIVECRLTPSGKPAAYQLTDAGWQLYPIVKALTLRGAKWALGEPAPEELNPILLLWWMRDRVYLDRLPRKQVVVEFKFREARPACYWLVLKPDDVSVCLKHPGFEIDVIVTAELAALYQVWLGRIPFDQALRDQRIQLDAVPALMHDFPNWFAFSPVVGILREAEVPEQISSG